MVRAKKKTRVTRKTKVVKTRKAAKPAQKKLLAKRKVKTSAKSKKKVSHVPKGYSSITPYLIISDNSAAQAIDFYKQVFGAKEIMRMDGAEGEVRHAELRIGDSMVMLADKCPEMNIQFPGSAVSIHLYIKDVDHIIERAVTAGATLTRPAENMFYGDRIGSVEDPFGHKWSIATHIEDLTPGQIKKRMAAMAIQKTPELELENI